MFKEMTVWDAVGYDTMGRRTFNLWLGIWTSVGIGFSAWVAWNSQHLNPNFWGVMGLFLISLAGVSIAVGNDSFFLSLLGYTLVTGSIGALTGPVIAEYTTASIVTIFFGTAFVVAALGVVGTIIPESLEHWSRYIIVALLILIFGHIALAFAAASGLPVSGTMAFWDWVGLTVFSFITVYDFNRAQRVPKTMNSAIDCALAIYLDFANIFLRLLGLSGKKSD
ncbi:US12 family protein [Candidatus Woesebacteria bacterium]|nr:US12 family protein [Candidatus Woesebacteria bacterium]